MRYAYDILVLFGLSSSLAASGFAAYQRFQPMRWIRNFINRLPSIIIKWFMKLFKEIFKALKYLWKIIASIGGTIKKAGEKIIRQLNRGIQKMLNEIVRGAKKVVKDVEKGGEKAIREVTNGGKRVIRKIGRAVTGVVNEVGGAGRRIANDIARSGERIFNDIRRKVNEAISRIGRFATDAVNKIKEVFDRAWRAIYDEAMRLKRIAEAAARAAAEAAREAARKAREAANAAARFFCFSGNTPIKLVDGKTVLLKHIKLEDTLINGTIVRATMQIKSSKEDPFYKIYSEELGEDVFVTGSHHIKWGDKYIPVREFEKAEKLDTVDDVLYCLVTSDHTIPVGEFTFWDWEDNLIPKA
jgi:hypothetical protein